MVGPARAALVVQAPVSRNEEDVVDAKSPSSRSPQEAGDEEVAASATGGALHGDVDTSRMALGCVLTTVAQVRAALRDARKAGLEGVVLWGRCSRCGRVGRVVHFDGELRARARAP
ncbi:hypothetical protein KKC91_12730 [bacterium]|nr:hypothetical protein [bacterium]